MIYKKIQILKYDDVRFSPDSYDMMRFRVLMQKPLNLLVKDKSYML